MFKVISIFLGVAIIASGVLTGCRGRSADTSISASTSTTNASTTVSSSSVQTSTIVTDNESDSSVDVAVAGRVVGLFTNLILIQDYFSGGLNQMSTAQLAASSSIVSIKNGIALVKTGNSDNGLSNLNFSIGPNQSENGIAYTGSIDNVPSGFIDPLPPDGAIDAPPGACPAGAKPSVSFATAGGNIVTPALIAQKGIQTIPSGLVTMSQDSPGSLMSIIKGMVSMGDQSLITPEGWNTKLWDKLRAMCTPAQSLMDYQIWVSSAELEQLIVTQFRQQLAAAGAPQIVLTAFDNSNKYGWYSTTQPTSQDALAEMRIEAEMTGTVNGTVYERRDFSIPSLGQGPVYGVQTGNGVVIWEDPRLGVVHFAVDIYLDQYDEEGRAIGGFVDAVAQEDNGYKVHFIFLPDGSKEGEVTKDGEVIGQLTMTVDQEKFENYIDVKKGTEIKLPEFSSTEG